MTLLILGIGIAIGLVGALVIARVEIRRDQQRRTIDRRMRS